MLNTPTENQHSASINRAGKYTLLNCYENIQKVSQNAASDVKGDMRPINAFCLLDLSESANHIYRFAERSTTPNTKKIVQLSNIAQNARFRVLTVGRGQPPVSPHRILSLY
jgi:hypothetical protein